MFQIKTRFTDRTLFECKLPVEVAGQDSSQQLGFLVQAAIRARTNLSGAGLSGAYLRRANLEEADLRGADLRRADLRRANLRGAFLSGAYLRGANLEGADLRGADLDGAYLSGAYLDGANLRGAFLRGAYLSGAHLIDGGQRSDGYRFVGYVKAGLRVLAGCRDFSMQEARDHWLTTRGGTPLGDETMAILDHLEAVARIRGLVTEAED